MNTLIVIICLIVIWNLVKPLVKDSSKKEIQSRHLIQSRSSYRADARKYRQEKIMYDSQAKYPWCFFDNVNIDGIERVTIWYGFQDDFGNFKTVFVGFDWQLGYQLPIHKCFSSALAMIAVHRKRIQTSFSQDEATAHTSFSELLKWLCALILSDQL